MKFTKLLPLLFLYSCRSIDCASSCTGPPYDMVEWMNQTYPGHESTFLGQSADLGPGPTSEYSFLNRSTHTFYRVNDAPDNNYFERYEYDNTNIYIRVEVQDRMRGNFLQSSNFVWTKRFVSVGPNCGTCSYSNGKYTRYTACVRGETTGTYFTMTVTGPITLDIGGDVGTVSALCLTQTNQNNPTFQEKYYYAIPWGMVYYERVVNGTVEVYEKFNTIYPSQLPNFSYCGRIPS